MVLSTSIPDPELFRMLGANPQQKWFQGPSRWLEVVALTGTIFLDYNVPYIPAALTSGKTSVKARGQPFLKLSGAPKNQITIFLFFSCWKNARVSPLRFRRPNCQAIQMYPNDLQTFGFLQCCSWTYFHCENAFPNRKDCQEIGLYHFQFSYSIHRLHCSNNLWLCDGFK